MFGEVTWYLAICPSKTCLEQLFYKMGALRGPLQVIFCFALSNVK